MCLKMGKDLYIYVLFLQKHTHNGNPLTPRFSEKNRPLSNPNPNPNPPVSNTWLLGKFIARGEAWAVDASWGGKRGWKRGWKRVKEGERGGVKGVCKGGVYEVAGFPQG